MADCNPTGLYQSWTNASQCPRIHSIFQGGCLTDDVSKPLALVLSSTIDELGAFSFTHKNAHDFLATLAKTHTTCHRYIQDSSEFNDLIERFGSQKKIDILAQRAHGSSLSQKYAKGYISLYSPRGHFAALRSSLTPDATIILDSCLNALTCGEGDFAGFIHSMAPPLATVYAATRPTAHIEVQSGARPEVKLFTRGGTDITYRSGTDGYCNNPIDPNDAHERKLRDLLDILDHQSVEQGQANEALIRVASETFKSNDDFWIRNSIIAYFEKILDKDQGFESAISVASEAFKSRNDWIRNRAIDLFRKIFEKGQGFKAAINAASEAFKGNTDGFTRSKAIKLLGNLVEKGQGFEAAISAVIEAFKSKDFWTYSEAFDLFEKLSDKGQDFNVARKCLSCYLCLKSGLC